MKSGVKLLVVLFIAIYLLSSLSAIVSSVTVPNENKATPTSDEKKPTPTTEPGEGILAWLKRKISGPQTPEEYQKELADKEARIKELEGKLGTVLKSLFDSDWRFFQYLIVPLIIVIFIRGILKRIGEWVFDKTAGWGSLGEKIFDKLTSKWIFIIWYGLFVVLMLIFSNLPGISHIIQFAKWLIWTVTSFLFTLFDLTPTIWTLRGFVLAEVIVFLIIAKILGRLLKKGGKVAKKEKIKESAEETGENIGFLARVARVFRSTSKDD